MGHVYTDVVVRGSRTEKLLPEVLIDTGATYTALPEELLQELEAWGPIGEVEVELANGQKVKAKAYALLVRIKEVEAPSIIITFKEAKTVVGGETLESIGLRLDPTTGNLEFTRPKGLVYFY